MISGKRLLAVSLADLLIAPVFIYIGLALWTPALDILPETFYERNLSTYWAAVGLVVYFYIIFLYVLTLIFGVWVTGSSNLSVRICSRNVIFFVHMCLVIIFLGYEETIWSTGGISVLVILAVSGVLSTTASEIISSHFEKTN